MVEAPALSKEARLEAGLLGSSTTASTVVLTWVLLAAASLPQRRGIQVDARTTLHNEKLNGTKDLHGSDLKNSVLSHWS